MIYRIFLGLFTFWVGVASTLTLPATALKSQFQLTNIVYAEVAPSNSVDAQAASCRYLATDIATKSQSASNALNKLTVNREREEKESIQLAYDAAVAAPLSGGNGSVQMNNLYITEIQDKLNGVRQRLLKQVNGETRQALNNYYSAVVELGKSKCAEFNTHADNYNQLATKFNNGVRKTVPDKPTAYADTYLQKASSAPSQYRPTDPEKIRLAILQYSRDYPSLSGDGKTPIDLVNLIDKNEPQNSNAPNAGIGSTNREGPVDANVDNSRFNTSQGPFRDCGCDQPNSSGFLGSLMSSIINPLCGLACIFFSVIYKNYKYPFKRADCLIHGSIQCSSDVSDSDNTLDFESSSEGDFSSPTNASDVTQPGTSPTENLLNATPSSTPQSGNRPSILDNTTTAPVTHDLLNLTSPSR